VTEYLSSDVCLPAIGQGALALEGRTDDRIRARPVVARLDHQPTAMAVTAERAFLERLEAVSGPHCGARRDHERHLDACALIARGGWRRRLWRDSLQGPCAMRIGSASNCGTVAPARRRRAPKEIYGRA